jgi:tetratricopeptide (TPR) repeat protein
MNSNDFLVEILGLTKEEIKLIQPCWKRVHYRAVINWLTQYEPAIDSSNIEQLRSYIESFYHLCEAESWKASQKILFSPLEDFNGNHLSLQLDQWSYYREEIELAQKLINKLDDLVDIDCLIIIGDGYLDLGKLDSAIEAFQHALRLSKASNNPRKIITCLSCIGLTLHYQGKYLQALQHYEEGLLVEIPCKNIEIEDLTQKAKLIGNLSLTYHHLDRYHDAAQYQDDSLTLFRQLGDLRGEAIALSGLGMINNSLGEYEKSIEYADRAWKIYEEIGDIGVQADALNVLGMSCRGLENYQQSIELHQEQLVLARQIGSLRDEANAVGNLSMVYEILEDYPKAIEYAKEQLYLADLMGDERGRGAALHSLGISLFYTSNISESLEKFQAALTIFKSVSSRSEEAEVLKDLASLYQHLQNFEMALKYCQIALEISRKLDLPLINDCEEMFEEIMEELSK